jgi:hypothetical protein
MVIPQNDAKDASFLRNRENDDKEKTMMLVALSWSKSTEHMEHIGRCWDHHPTLELEFKTT